MSLNKTHNKTFSDITMPSQLDKYQIEKLGNTLIYLSERVGEFNKTKALKLLFLLEEKSIKEFGVPYFGFDFKVWQYGPVVPEVYNDIEEGLPILSKYIKKANYDESILESASIFNDDEFSNNDVYLMDELVKFARHKTAFDLVQYTHQSGSLWHNSVVKHNLRDAFLTKAVTMTNISIDFLESIKDDEFIKERYFSTLDFMNTNRLLKNI